MFVWRVYSHVCFDLVLCFGAVVQIYYSETLSLPVYIIYRQKKAWIKPGFFYNANYFRRAQYSLKCFSLSGKPICAPLTLFVTAATTRSVAP